MQEKQIEKKLVEGIKALGGVAYKFISPGNDGVPDRIVVLPGGRIVFVELKTETGRLTNRQRFQIKMLTHRGFEVWTLYGAEHVKAFLMEMRGRMLVDGIAAGLTERPDEKIVEGGGFREIYPARLSEEGSLFYPEA